MEDEKLILNKTQTVIPEKIIEEQKKNIIKQIDIENPEAMKILAELLNVSERDDFKEKQKIFSGLCEGVFEDIIDEKNENSNLKDNSNFSKNRFRLFLENFENTRKPVIVASNSSNLSGLFDGKKENQTFKKEHALFLHKLTEISYLKLEQIRDQKFVEKVKNIGIKILDKFDDKSTGFGCTLLENKNSSENKLYLSIKGTEIPDIKDDVADIHMAVGSIPIFQFSSLVKYFKNLIEKGLITKNKKINLTGHSLGGTLVQMLSVVFPDYIENSYTFDTYGARGLKGIHTEKQGLTGKISKINSIANPISSTYKITKTIKNSPIVDKFLHKTQDYDKIIKEVEKSLNKLKKQGINLPYNEITEFFKNKDNPIYGENIINFKTKGDIVSQASVDIGDKKIVFDGYDHRIAKKKEYILNYPGSELKIKKIEYEIKHYRDDNKDK